MNECISFVFSNNYNNYYKFLNKMSSSDDDMLVDPEGFYTRALADFDAYAKSIGLEGKWWDNFEMWEWYGVPHLTLAENTELVRLNFLCRTVDAWLNRHCLLCHSSSSSS